MGALGPFGPSPRLIVGVSGGPHSLALALLARRWAESRGGRLLAAICDHGLRPESRAEAASVALQLGRRGISSKVLPLGLAPGPGAQERARAARLAALLDVCRAEGAPWLLLGHHRADQAETLLLRALAGSRAAGLAGMGAARGDSAALVLRPLLGCAPARLEAVVAAEGFVPVRDPSNADPRFARVRLRAALADPGGEGGRTLALAEAARRFACRRDARAAAIGQRLGAAAWLHEAGFARLDLAALGEDQVAVDALRALLRAVGGRAFAPSPAAVAALLARGEGTLAGVTLRRPGLLVREAARCAPPVPARPGAVWDGRFRLSAGMAGAALGAAGAAALGLPRPRWLPASAVPGLPALHRNGTLAVVPALAYPDAATAAAYVIRFAPISGPVA